MGSRQLYLHVSWEQPSKQQSVASQLGQPQAAAAAGQPQAAAGQPQAAAGQPQAAVSTTAATAATADAASALTALPTLKVCQAAGHNGILIPISCYRVPI